MTTLETVVAIFIAKLVEDPLEHRIKEDIRA